MKLSSLVLKDKRFRREHRSLTMFSEMDSLVTKFECKNEKILAYGSDTDARGITKISFYKEVSISGVVLVLNVYLQATGDKVYYHSCSILDDVLGLNIFDPTDYARFVWLKESLLEQVSSYLTYEIDYSSSTTKDIEEGLKRSLLDLTDFKVREDEPCKY
jgi:hypothetical protein|nr:MAG TPA: hypothetical protein [Caudoviricetes sp.]